MPGVRGGSALAGRVCVRGLWRVGRGLASIAGASRLPTLSKADLGAGGNRVPPHALAPASVVSRCLGAHEPRKYGANALGLQRVLGLGSYKTAWVWLHKLRRAMVRPDRDQLSGVVQVDESYVGGVEAGVRGRETIKKAIVAIAAEVDGRKIGRIRLRWVPDLSAPVLRGFVKDSIAPASTVHTDGWPSYQGLAKLGFRHTVTNLSTSGDPAHVLMSAVHRVASLLKRWVLGTLQGGIAREHLPYYLDEFTFRFNRRTSRARGLLFYRLLEQAVQCAPTPASALYLGTGRGKRPAEPR